MPDHTVSPLSTHLFLPYISMMHKEFCNSDFYSSLFREVAGARLRSVHADKTIHNHFFSDPLLYQSLSTCRIESETMLTILHRFSAGALNWYEMFYEFDKMISDLGIHTTLPIFMIETLHNILCSSICSHASLSGCVAFCPLSSGTEHFRLKASRRQRIFASSIGNQEWTSDKNANNNINAHTGGIQELSNRPYIFLDVPSSRYYPAVIENKKNDLKRPACPTLLLFLDTDEMPLVDQSCKRPCYHVLP